MPAILEVVEDDIIARIEAAIPYLRKVTSISSAEELDKAGCSPPSILVLYDGTDRSGDASTPVCAGRPIKQRLALRFTCLILTRALRTSGGRRGEEGAYQVLDELREALLGKAPALPCLRRGYLLLEEEPVTVECPNVIYASRWDVVVDVDEVTP